MNPRTILRLMVLVLMAVLVQSFGPRETVAAQTQNAPFSNLKPNPQTGLLADPVLPAGMHYESANYNSIFGQPCCIRPKGVSQGATLGDCFFMSSIDALAMVSPGTIDNAIQYNSGSNTFTLKFFTPPAGRNEETTLPWVPHTYTTSAEVPFANVWSRLWGATVALVKDGGGWTQAKDAYQQAMGANSAEKALWPLLLEKGYAALQPNGYQSLGEGGNGMFVMHALTGVEGDQWLIPNPQPQRLQVTVKNMPAVSDLNGHCIICGILDGRGLTAVEPNIQVCLTIPGTQAKPSSDYCTPVCKPGHECTALFPSDTPATLANTSSLIEVADIPGPGKKNEIAVLKKIPSQCTSSKPCTQQPLDTRNLAAAPVDPLSVSFQSIARSGPEVAMMSNPDGTKTQVKTLDTLEALDHQLVLLTDAYNGTPKEPVIAGTMPECPSDVRCVSKSNAPLAQKYNLYANHEYYLKKYTHNADLTKATVTMGNPWGFADPDPLPLPAFRYYFVHIAVNNVKPIQPRNCSCGQ